MLALWHGVECWLGLFLRATSKENFAMRVEADHNDLQKFSTKTAPLRAQVRSKLSGSSRIDDESTIGITCGDGREVTDWARKLAYNSNFFAEAHNADAGLERAADRRCTRDP